MCVITCIEWINVYVQDDVLVRTCACVYTQICSIFYSSHSDVLGSLVHKSENTITHLHLLNLLHIMHPADAFIICTLFILLPQTKPNVTSLAASKKKQQHETTIPAYDSRIWNPTTFAKVKEGTPGSRIALELQRLKMFEDVCVRRSKFLQVPIKEKLQSRWLWPAFYKWWTQKRWWMWCVWVFSFCIFVKQKTCQ